MKQATRWVERILLWGVPFAATGLLLGTVAFAIPYGIGAYSACQYGTCEIILTSNGSVNLTATPTVTGVYSTASDDVTVETHSSTGYTLTFQDTDTNTNLVSGSNTIAASAGTQPSPISLAMNTWGYRVDGLAGFGAGPTSAQNSEPTSSYTFAGVPASNQIAHTLKVTAAEADPPETTVVWYGVRIDSTTSSGAYTDTVIYTAVINN